MTAVTPATSLAANVAAVRARIAAACERSGRDPAGVRLIAVSKTMPADAIAAAINAGVTDIGENYVQEAAAKRTVLGRAAAGAVWHLIGHLQSNKVAASIEAFDVIHTVDSLRLAQAIDRRAAHSVPVTLEVNVAAEATKFGFAPDEVAATVAAVSNLGRIDLRGLMTVAPAAEPSVVRSVFRNLRQLARANGLSDLSMGMSGDFEVAIEEGSTMVRIGRAIFGERLP
ncbi:MAG TPA: YggS family pyridoxal phosphate-dependent enzyme [Dehalococcoidia bacterium]